MTAAARMSKINVIENICLLPVICPLLTEFVTEFDLARDTSASFFENVILELRAEE